MAEPDATVTTHDGGATTVVAEAAGEADALLGRGARLGRYVVLGHVGSGAMGVVYAAYDPELDRKVALKLLRAGAGAAGQRARLLREAQALAKLAHPNVVAVHDVGALGDHVFVAMEFVDGVTLTRWLGERAHEWREVLELFVAVGRGLAAAHQAGLVHRDLKPDNVMIGADGRVRVMDFGLARADDLGTTLHDSQGPRSSALELEITREGAVLGTPRYMAPEQWHGAIADARADQFALCVALWEALYGELPFRGGTAAALMLAVTRGVITPPTRPGRAPRWLRRVVERGLATAPEDRFASLDALLAALTRGQTRARRRWLAGGLVACVAAVGALLGARQLERVRGVAACEAAGAEIEAVWNEAARDSLEAALMATGVSFAGDTFARALPWIDRWSGEWSRVRIDECVAAEVEATRSPELHALSLACLDERRDELAALLAVQTEVDAAGVGRVVSAAAGLSPVAACVEAAALARRPPLPADEALRGRVAELRRELLRVLALQAAGKHVRGLARAEELLGEAEAIGYAPLVVEARAVLGGLASNAGKLDVAEEALTRAYVDGGAQELDGMAMAAATQLVFTVGSAGARYPEGQQWARSAEMLVRRLGQVDRLPEADLLTHLASVHRVHGEYEEALALYVRALEIRERELGGEHPHVARALHNLGNVYEATGRFAEALEVHARALAMMQRTLGPSHPNVGLSYNSQAVIHEKRDEHERALELHARALAIHEQVFGPEHANVAGSLNNMALVHEARGELAAAQRLYERALAIRERTLRPDDPDIADTLDNLAGVHRAQGRLDEALALRERALAITEGALGSAHPDVAGNLNNLALIHEERGELARAQELYERAIAIHSAALGPEHPHVAETLVNLAGVHRARGEFAAAQGLYERALAIWERSPEREPRQLGHALVGLGELALERGRPAEAVAPLERAEKLWPAGEVPPLELAELRFALARALGRDSPRGRELARLAADAYREAGSVHVKTLAAALAWQAAGRGG
ncbi:serine/threonine-protein kinase [Nannocystis sp.]|uniref:serine/threonine-protein kinase n=1 Tax=Nannocystis sp. TaxID=1962667 RepID=UPI0025D93E87|nr:serine/threonine-protein kinase [Nannocystis sp.]MBK7828796.1 tetratricopeptide repeat protein [Nannocystis sp.]